jgi:hypothetical protein
MTSLAKKEEAPLDLDTIFDGLNVHGHAVVNLPDDIASTTNKLALEHINKISNEMPANCNVIHASSAEYLAGRFLRAMEICGDLLSTALRHEKQMDSEKRKEFAGAVLERSKDRGLKTMKERELYGYMDELYLTALKRHDDAVAFRIYLAQRHKTFEKGHHMLRKLAEQHTDGFDSSANVVFESKSLSLDANKNIETDWDEAWKS